MEHSFERGRFDVHYLIAPYDLLAKAFGNDGTVSPRDDYKSMAEWDIETPDGQVEVYDYKVGTCYRSNGLERHEITRWHVQGSDDAVACMLSLVAKAEESES